MVNPVIYNPELGLTQDDLDVAISMHLELFQTHFPLLTYKVLNKEVSVSDDFYGDTDSEYRKYVPYELNLHPSFDPADYLYERYGIDRQREVIFRVCNYQLTLKEIDPKAGDRIIFDGSDYDVKTYKRNAESYFGFTNYSFVGLLVTDIPTPSF